MRKKVIWLNKTAYYVKYIQLTAHSKLHCGLSNNRNHFAIPANIVLFCLSSSTSLAHSVEIKMIYKKWLFLHLQLLYVEAGRFPRIAQSACYKLKSYLLRFWCAYVRSARTITRWMMVAPSTSRHPHCLPFMHYTHPWRSNQASHVHFTYSTA